MNQKTKPEVWPTDRPYIVFLVPANHAGGYAAAMNQLLNNVLLDLGWGSDSVEMIGFVSASPRHGVEGLFFLEETGVDTRRVTLLMLWAEAGDCINWDGLVPEECGVGRVVLPATGAVIPAVRMPSLESDWWSDPLHEAYAETVVARLIQDGRPNLTGKEPFAFVTPTATWN